MSIENYKNKITEFYKSKRRMPTYVETMKLVGFKSKNAVFKLVNKLSDDGFLTKDKNGRLAPAKIYGELRLLGLVEAGFPSAAEEELADTMSLDEYLIPNKDSSYILKVKGDSMIDAGIHEGDMVIVERTNNPKEGEIVIAEIDGAWTMKYFRKKYGKPYLEAANKKYKPIFAENELKIAAVVKAVVRKY
ncbi:MAG: repressor LexA [Candidatus Taylorbacteria bacterium RIFCSPLOWO2_01_FULL_45_15b]|uniref:Repressor LexA n=1 Tax=Candidatus Taylorbacteria bacterium RIFCSPLOWO2_01_FULL_45_15b TaxID=1802319 RepID=A0A1G2NCL4_9BACT|nr:MAG: repressor LexA [Candidatus Taylorbacteria bacterium RIFCSPLOWO2_01_FULL_45_15b]